MRPLPPFMSTTSPSTVISSPPPILAISAMVFLVDPESTMSNTASTLLTSQRSPMFSWGMPFQARM